jgi:hypothetical protein
LSRKIFSEYSFTLEFFIGEAQDDALPPLNLCSWTDFPFRISVAVKAGGQAEDQELFKKETRLLRFLVRA